MLGIDTDQATFLRVPIVGGDFCCGTEFVVSYGFGDLINVSALSQFIKNSRSEDIF